MLNLDYLISRASLFLILSISSFGVSIKKVAGVKGLDLVLNSSETQLGVFYVSDKSDFTEEVIITLNAELK